ncbi:unnamed protein product [Cylindrotheca closterium]|uniref:UBX domain-containing protein n=1 Tax=Cylindrotheca closterium TaxID=2856 RepID=A0AAD2CN09_9STRA|nr:unnamed protein product [Cylindrotheca closterium]
MSNNDELISQFLAFTGSSDTAKASSYLEMSAGNVETAVGLFLEHEGGGGSGAAGGAAAGGTGGGMPDVRAPDATRTMRLMDDGPMFGGGSMMMGGGGANQAMMGMMEHMLEDSLRYSAFADDRDNIRDTVNASATSSNSRRRRRNTNNSDENMAIDVDADENNQDDNNNNNNNTNNSNSNMDDGDDDDMEEYDYDDDDDDEDGDDDGGAAQSQVARLADIFAAPDHLMFKEGGFEGARTMAKDNKRWLLVNIQRDNEFSSHALNRDVWRDELVENLIREGFIFWQTMDVSPEGKTYIQRYKVGDFPHVAFIDPRTRRLLWRKEGWTQENPLTAESFAEYAMDFCSKYTFDKPPVAPRPGAARAPPKKKAMNEMSEAEQLQAAMRASLEDISPASEGKMEDGDDDDEQEVQVLEPDENGKPRAVESKEEAKPSLLDELLAMTLGEEPAKGARVMIRTPDGKRNVRKFDASQTVKTIYAHFVQSSDEAKGGKEFILQESGFPPKDLLPDIDQTIASRNLSGAALTLRWKD